MIYEMRRYEALPGKMAALHEVMEKIAMPVFEKLGMEVVGVWEPSVGDFSNVLMYILAWDSVDERNRKWEAFLKDSDWIEPRSEIAKREGGPLVEREIYYFLSPTSYSPLK